MFCTFIHYNTADIVLLLEIRQNELKRGKVPLNNSIVEVVYL